MKNYDYLFEEKAIFAQAEFVKGILPVARTDKDVFVKNEGEECEKGSFVLYLENRSVYEVRFANKPAALRCARCDFDPRELKVGQGVSTEIHEHLPYFEGEVDVENADFICTPNKNGQYLIIYTGSDEEFFIGESPVSLGYDTDDCWFYTPVVGDLNGGEGSWGNWDWSLDELLEAVYEPMRAKYPEYITRSWIGKDQTGTYDMWQYTFAPENYEQTIFITGGLHATEMDGYLSLAHFLQIMADEDGTHEGLHYLRTKVRLIVVPVVNVHSAATTHDRKNSQGIDLNRDFGDHSQAETVNVLWLLHQYKDEVGVIIDFHGAVKRCVPLYYQFSMQAKNSKVCRKVSNHIQQELLKRGWEKGEADLKYLPGKYNKSDKYLQGYCWNTFGIPTLVVEHNRDRWYDEHAAEALQWGTECYGNFLIQTALAKIKIIEKK
ncbi:MAG: hypothetical protein IKZ15_02475 [Clostridia bacterium]|nr:hypothetical protein [Clostridia bacterium]